MKQFLLILQLTAQILAKVISLKTLPEDAQKLPPGDNQADPLAPLLRSRLDDALDQVNQGLPQMYRSFFGNLFTTTVKGAFLVFVNEMQLSDTLKTIYSIESNMNLNYPWIFLHEKPLSSEFKSSIHAISKNEVKFGVFEQVYRHLPKNVIENAVTHNKKTWANYKPLDTIMHMRQLYAGLFADHPLLDGIDYIWRVRFKMFKID
jgi:hypothetical protein